MVVVVTSTFYQLQLQSFWEKKALSPLTHSLDTSRHDYCNTLYVGSPLEMAQKLQLFQNTGVYKLAQVSKGLLTSFPYYGKCLPITGVDYLKVLCDIMHLNCETAAEISTSKWGNSIQTLFSAHCTAVLPFQSRFRSWPCFIAPLELSDLSICTLSKLHLLQPFQQ